MRLTSWILVVALALTLAACATTGAAGHPGSASATSAATAGEPGTVTGTFTRVGGPLGAAGTQPRPVPLTGTLIFSAGHHRVVAVQVGKKGRFAVTLPAGIYVVSGRSPSLGEVLASGAVLDPPCTAPTPVNVAAGRTVHVCLVCAVP